MKRKASLLLYCLLYLASCQVSADDVVWNGFVSQGITQSSGSNFIDDEGDVSAGLTEIGVNSSYRLSPSLRLAGQVVYLNGANRYPEGPRIDFMFVDWSVVNTFDWQVALKLGRIKNLHWYYSATRDVPHTRPSIFLPQSVYFDVFRDVALASDGAALNIQTMIPLGDIEFNWSYGKSSISDTQMRNLLSNAARGDLKQEFDHQASVRLTPENSAWQFGVNILDSDFTYTSSGQEALYDGTATSQRIMFQMSYQAEHWNVVSELLRERVTFNGVLFPGFYNQATAEGGYLQGEYSLSPSIKVLARVDIFDRDRKDRKGRGLELISGGVIPGYFGFQDTGTLGLQWDFADQWRVQAEYHRVKGTGRLAPVLSPNIQINNQKYWNVWAVQVMHWF